MRRLRFGDLDALCAELAVHTRQAWPPPPAVLHRLGVELAPPSTHAVVRTDIEGERCALKIFRSWDRGEPDREWSMLTLLEDTGLAPRPVWRSANADPPVIVTGWLDGRALRPDALTPSDMSALGRAHETIHALPVPAGVPIALSAGSVARERVLDSWEGLPALAAQIGLDAAIVKRLSREPFAASSAVAEAIEDSPLVASRGDTHVKNYLRSGGGVQLLDFEDAGVAQPVFELADMIEHFGNRSVREEMWRELVWVAQAPAEPLAVARGLLAEFWFTVVVRRGAQGLPMSPPVTAGEQLERLETLTAAFR